VYEVHLFEILEDALGRVLIWHTNNCVDGR
jgi:hypothetical protein